MTLVQRRSTDQQKQYLVVVWYGVVWCGHTRLGVWYLAVERPALRRAYGREGVWRRKNNGLIHL